MDSRIFVQKCDGTMTATPRACPEGFEFTGAYRFPCIGEFYLDRNGQIMPGDSRDREAKFLVRRLKTPEEIRESRIRGQFLGRYITEADIAMIERIFSEVKD